MIKNSQTLLTFWGTRGSIPTPGRITEKYGGNTPCVSVESHGQYIIFDAGSGIRNYGLELNNSGLGTDTDPLSLCLFLSHTHWDHIQGLPFFNPAYINGNKLVIYGSPKKEKILGTILSGQMDFHYFPITMSNLAADISIKEITGEEIRLGDVVIDWQEQHYHPGGCVRYRLGVDGKKIVYASDVELNFAFYPKKKTAETELHAQEYLDFIQGADLLIADGQFTGEEYETKAGWGHTSIPLLLEVAYKANVKQLALFHHDPQHSDKFLNDLWSKYSPQYHTADPPMHIFWAREGLTMPI